MKKRGHQMTGVSSVSLKRFYVQFITTKTNLKRSWPVSPSVDVRGSSLPVSVGIVERCHQHHLRHRDFSTSGYLLRRFSPSVSMQTTEGRRNGPRREEDRRTEGSLLPWLRLWTWDGIRLRGWWDKGRDLPVPYLDSVYPGRDRQTS